MAYKVGYINVADLKPSIGIGVGLPFSNVTAFKTVYTTKEQLKYNIINFLLTDQRERVFNPTFGASIRARLFEQITTESNEALRSNIQMAVENYFPSVQITTLSVQSNPDYSEILVQFSYKIRTSNESDTIILNLQNG